MSEVEGGREREREREGRRWGGILMMSKSNRIDHPILLENTAVVEGGRGAWFVNEGKEGRVGFVRHVSGGRIGGRGGANDGSDGSGRSSPWE